MREDGAGAMMRSVTTGPEAPKAVWINDLPSGPTHKEMLANLADLDHGHEGFLEYEAAADADHMRLETAQRSYRGQYLRYVRRLLAASTIGFPIERLDL
jgi:hypothetical protein